MINSYETIAFSHRPKVGVSIGIWANGSRAYIAASICNKKSGDTFSRKRARHILTGRIQRSIPGFDVDFVEKIKTTKDAWSLMKRLRESFKPDPSENDNLFPEGRPRKEIWLKIRKAFQEKCVS